MADYENLLDSIDAVIRSNNRREITGQILQNTLHQMVGSLGENYQLAGFATPTLDPNSPDQNVFYVTDEAGVYTNFDNITLGNGLSFLMWKNEEWTSKTLDIVTADWVDEHYVSKAFLRKVFQFFDEDGVEIFPNDTESVVDNIKAMCGLWTNEYLSALGLGEGSTIPTTLAALNDVTITNPQDGQALVYDLASSHWVNRTIQSGVDMSVVWAALAAATNEQINISHLTTALNDYVTATSLATTLQSYVTTSALATELASYASQSWVETNYVSKVFFNSLFQAQDANGNAITPNNSGQTTIDRLKILVGAYTEQYLSALGLSSGGGGGGSSTLAGLNDVTITNPQDGQALIYDAQSSHWVNGAAISMSAVWTALAVATSEQINSSHLTSALSGYVTTSALASELANYVTTSSLATTLADYVTTSALATTLADYGSKTWIDNNYVSKAFFNRLFQAFAPLAEGQTEPTQVEPNDTTTTIDNIKAMFGLWTEQYLSALGLSSDAGHSIGVLDDLNDVTITNPQTNQVLKYNGTQWVNAAAPSGASALSGLTDVAISSLADKDLLQWDYATGKWKNVVLSTAMSAYALASAIPTNVSQLNNDSGFVTSSALSNYLPLSGGTISGTNRDLLTLNQTGNSAIGSCLGFYTNGVRRGLIGFNSSFGIFLNGMDSSGNLECQLYMDKDNAYFTGSNNSFKTILHSGNSAVSKSGSTLSVKINGTTESLTDSWRGMQNNLTTSSSSTSDSLSAYQGYLLANGSARDNTKLPLSGGTLTNSDNDGYYGSPLKIVNSKTSGNVWLLSMLAANLNNGGNSLLMIGEENSRGKSAWFGYSKKSDGTGFATIGLYNVDRIINVFENGNVGIGTESPSYKLSVNGDVSATNFRGSLIGNADSATYATTAGSAPASDVYSWAKASTKPSYSFSEINGNPSSTQITNGLGYTPVNKAGDTMSGALTVSTTSYPFRLQTSGQECSMIFAASGSTAEYGQYVLGNYTSTTSGYSAFFLYDATLGYQTLHIENGRVGIGIQATYPSYALHVGGDIYATGGVTALSDIRKKDVTGYNLPLNVEQIANAPTIKFLWKDKREEGEQAGTIAQYWQNVLPWVIKDKSGELSMQYGVAALISSITIARKVVDHEQRITKLERENADLKQAYSFIKNAYDYLKMDYENLKLKIA